MVLSEIRATYTKLINFHERTMRLYTYIFFVILLPLMLSGCGSMPLMHHLTPDSHQIKLGEKAFAAGKYQEAEKIFSEVYDGNSTKEAKNTALYYLASTRIITAQNTSQFMSAVGLLEEWKTSYPKLMYGEDPDVLKKALEVGSKNMAGQQQSLRRIVANQKMQIGELQEDVKTLQHQISQLEAIDQQIQEKRKPL